jgi:UDP-N-acetylmuramoylalanine--D-glutamate ligase
MTAPNPSWPAVFAGDVFAVLGLGRNGLPAALALRSMGAVVTVWDDHPDARAAAMREGLRVALPAHTASLTALILSPGIPHRLPKPHPQVALILARGVPIWSDAEALFIAVRRAGSDAKFIGITGTNGKSTTTALTAHILQHVGMSVAAGGNLGPAALALPLLDKTGIYVLEMSSYMLERIATMRFNAASMLNLSLDHLDRHGSFAEYAIVKAGIFARQTQADTAVIGIDDPTSELIAEQMARRPVPMVRISGERGADLYAQNGVLQDQHGVLADLRMAQALPGTHNAQNAAAASALAMAVGVPRADIGPALLDFPGLPHRQALIAEIDGVSFINDSKATNADAAARALACHERVIWIAGGVAKSGGIASLAPYFPRVAHALLIGQASADFATTLNAHGVAHSTVDTLDRAVESALAHARTQNVPTVLLAPACASFDQFVNYEARGEMFTMLVHQLAKHRTAGAS